MMLDALTYLSSITTVIWGIVCLMGIAIFTALVGWGLEILRRRDVTLIVLFGMALSAFLLAFLLLLPRIGPPIVNTVRPMPIPTIQATAEPPPTATPTPAPTRRVRGG